MQIAGKMAKPGNNGVSKNIEMKEKQIYKNAIKLKIAQDTSRPYLRIEHLHNPAQSLNSFIQQF